MSFRSKLRRLPQVITLMRKEAGFRSQGAAARGVRAKTGLKLNKAQISQWERGLTMPNLTSLLAFLEGLGYTLHDFQDELDRAAGVEVAKRTEAEAEEPEVETAPTADPPAAEMDLASRLSSIEERLRSLEGGGES